jgi:heme A synthase
MLEIVVAVAATLIMALMVAGGGAAAERMTATEPTDREPAPPHGANRPDDVRRTFVLPGAIPMVCQAVVTLVSVAASLIMALMVRWRPRRSSHRRTPPVRPGPRPCANET